VGIGSALPPLLYGEGPHDIGAWVIDSRGGRVTDAAFLYEYEEEVGEAANVDAEGRITCGASGSVGVVIRAGDLAQRVTSRCLLLQIVRPREEPVRLRFGETRNGMLIRAQNGRGDWIDGFPFTMTSSDPRVLQITEEGQAKAVGAGSATLTEEAVGIVASVKVEVSRQVCGQVEVPERQSDGSAWDPDSLPDLRVIVQDQVSGGSSDSLTGTLRGTSSSADGALWLRLLEADAVMTPTQELDALAVERARLDPTDVRSRTIHSRPETHVDWKIALFDPDYLSDDEIGEGVCAVGRPCSIGEAMIVTRWCE
jgi:hypothetical protein